MAELRIQFLDVGQGDGIFLQFPGGETMLVDLGSTKNKKIASADILKYFTTHTKFSKVGQTLDYLILTHGDRDHYNVVNEFLMDRQIQVSRLLYGGEADDYHGLINEILTNRSPGCVAGSPTGGFPFELLRPSGASFGDDAHVYVLAANAPAPSKTDEGWRKNTNSVVLMVVYRGAKVILAGDATTDTEKFIFGTLMHRFGGKLDQVLGFLNSHVLKLAHHGSHRTSNQAAWIQAIQPRFVFISADRHGSLDDNTTTGHRLPQSLTLSLIQKHSSSLYKQCADHNIVSAFDTGDYDGYNTAPDTTGDSVTAPTMGSGATATWWEQSTKEGLFTSLVAMDRSDPNASDYDQGAQYQLSISDTGMVEVTSTYSNKSVVAPVSVQKL